MVFDPVRMLSEGVNLGINIIFLYEVQNIQANIRMDVEISSRDVK